MSWLPPVSVIVPALDAARTLGPCIDSLLGLRYPRDRLELIAVDNGSSDGTREIARRYAEITLVEEPVRGRAAARNRGLRAAAHEIVAMTDADCTVDPDWLRNLVEPLRDESVALVGGRILASRRNHPIAAFGEQIHDNEKAIRVFRPPYVSTANWASRRAVLDQVGGFDEALPCGEDSDFAYRCFRAGLAPAYAPEAVVYHRNEESRAGLFREGYRHGFASVRLHKKHAVLLRQMGSRRLQPNSYVRLLSLLAASARTGASSTVRSALAFESGKKAGKLLGSFRFLYPDL
jgi:cellulose synthase/poly-beta-1,6-N-acetylglucosamine synthase-like glycosyltransferase